MSATKFPVSVDPNTPIFPGDDVIAIANFNNPTEDIMQVRFLWF